MPPSHPQLVFVYNAKPGLAAGVLDSVHKFVSPATYPCSLCAVTHGALRMQPRWRDWLRATAADALFYHRPDFRAAYPAVTEPLPGVFVRRGDGLATLVGKTELDALPDSDALAALIDARLAAYDPG